MRVTWWASVPEEGADTNIDADHVGVSAKGMWPAPYKQYWWDLLPGQLPDKWVPPRSGIKEPDIDVSWITALVAKNPAVLEATRRAHERERERAESAEAKASRLVTLCLSLLTIAIALGAYQLSVVRSGDVHAAFLLPAALSIVALVAAGITSLEIDRVGIYANPGAKPHLKSDPDCAVLIEEEVARGWASWTAGRKMNQLLNARAWLSRAMLCLLASAIVAAVMVSEP